MLGPFARIWRRQGPDGHMITIGLEKDQEQVLLGAGVDYETAFNAAMVNVRETMRLIKAEEESKNPRVETTETVEAGPLAQTTPATTAAEPAAPSP